MRRLYAFLSILPLIVLPAGPAFAHGLVGKRFFPSTLAIEDPTVSDELSLPSILHIKGPEGKETTLGAEFSKTITPSLAVSIGAEYRFLEPADPDERSTSGFGNPELGVKYQLVTINGETGKKVGVRALVHFFIDDIYPAVFRPLIR